MDPVLTPHEKSFLWVTNPEWSHSTADDFDENRFDSTTFCLEFLGRFKGLKVKKFIDMIYFYFPKTFPIRTLAWYHQFLRMRKVRSEGLKGLSFRLKNISHYLKPSRAAWQFFATSCYLQTLLLLSWVDFCRNDKKKFTFNILCTLLSI